jgi:hypothetical protein
MKRLYSFYDMAHVIGNLAKFHKKRLILSEESI